MIALRHLVIVPLLLTSSCERRGSIQDAANKSEQVTGSAATEIVRQRANPKIEDTESLEKDKALRLQSELDTLAYGEKYRHISVQLAKHLAEHDPDGGKQWLQNLEQSLENLPAVGSFAMVLAKEDPVEACRFASSLTYQPFRNQALKAALCYYAIIDGPASWHLLDKYAGSVENSGILKSEVMRNMAGASLADAWNVIASIDVDDPDLRGQMMSAFFEGARFSSSDEGFAWLNRMPENAPERMQALDTLIRRQPEDSMHDVSQYLAALPPSRERDVGAAALVDKIYGNSPAEAAEWASSIQSDEIRYRAFNKIIDYANGVDSSLASRIATMRDAER